ncbi:EI24 domain-containing protein [Aliarcobacter butzleri]|uniref:EI24 domain-containing protein n=1 Tax=Aliarcobacter butzleri TaxID=28197 RepID=UPI0021B2A87B|nr:EI24 domain-containing protein [Aliarcobacter butzleri]MCT7611295.1 EI24 domain-containing protein [Aliarcobacter butzleri]
MNEVEVIFKSIKDFFSSPMLKIAIVPLIVTMIILYALFFMAADFGFSALKEVAVASQNGQEVVIDENAPFYFVWLTYAIVFLFKYSFVSWIAVFLFYTLGTILILQISVILTLIVIGFLTPMILQNLHQKYYSHLQLDSYGTLSLSLWVLFKNLFMMFLLFILLIPVYFVPVLNVIAFALPLYYFFHKLLNFDVSSTILNKTQYKIIYEKEANKFRLRTLFLYFISMIPFATLFSAVFFVIYLGHSYFIELEKMNKNSVNKIEA